MMMKFRKLTILAATAAVVASALPAQAEARGWHHHHHHGGSGAWIPFAVIGGLAAGALIADSANSRERYYPERTYYAPPPPAYSNRPCNVVHRLEDVDGYTVKMAATMCYDASGRPYIVQGSQHPVDETYDY